MRYTSPLLVFVIAMWATWSIATGWAQAGSGFYVSGEVGANFAMGLNTTGTSNDRASVCDEYINPRYQEMERCTGPDRSVGGRWENEFDGATGYSGRSGGRLQFCRSKPEQPLGRSPRGTGIFLPAIEL